MTPRKAGSLPAGGKARPDLLKHRCTDTEQLHIIDIVKEQDNSDFPLAFSASMTGTFLRMAIENVTPAAHPAALLGR